MEVSTHILLIYTYEKDYIKKFDFPSYIKGLFTPE